MQDRKQRVFFDTSFFIRLYKQDDPDHKNARNYWERFRKENYEMFLSTIVAAEFGAGGAIKQLPYKYVTILPFNINDAERSSVFAQVAFENKRRPFLDLIWLSGLLNIDIPRIIHAGQPIDVKRLIKQRHALHSLYTNEQAEGLVYRVERNGEFDFMAKYVRQDFIPGKLLKKD